MAKENGLHTPNTKRIAQLQKSVNAWRDYAKSLEKIIEQMNSEFKELKERFR